MYLILIEGFSQIDVFALGTSFKGRLAEQYEVVMMTAQSTYEKIVQELNNLPVEHHQQVLTWLRNLNQSKSSSTQNELPKGTPRSVLAEFVGTISKRDAKLMQQAIDEACGVVNLDEW